MTESKSESQANPFALYKKDGTKISNLDPKDISIWSCNRCGKA